MGLLSVHPFKLLCILLVWLSQVNLTLEACHIVDDNILLGECKLRTEKTDIEWLKEMSAVEDNIAQYHSSRNDE